jgi:Holliday junction resolvasome RuvABC DNA-binding subunit
LGELNLKDERPLLEDDVMLSLEQLGFDRKERERVLKLIPKDLVSTEDRLSWCLQNLSK